ncbi:hypothetical protein N018_01265 [Pseudomonas syringae CC1557]|uniref:Uncharacterized protein n=1 Tax=Pseudomonas syringae CC1557 TaxID=1357279 RepID=W0N361_PSESX|nr:hypothetical protein N018_01265 [Pseudomonas syringae CC1557]
MVSSLNDIPKAIILLLESGVQAAETKLIFGSMEGYI